MMGLDLNSFKKYTPMRLLYSTIGVLMIGLGVGIVIEMAIGNSSCDCLYRSVYYILCEKFGEFPYGHVNLGMNFLIFIAMIFIKPSLIGYGTVFNMISVGYVVDLVHYLFGVMGTYGFELPVWVRILAVVLSLPIMAFGDARILKRMWVSRLMTPSDLWRKSCFITNSPSVWSERLAISASL